MNVTKKVKKLQKKLDRLMQSDSGHKKARRYLKSLKSLPVTLEILTETRIGKTVNLVRKWCKSTRAQDLGRDIIKDWKALLVVSTSECESTDDSTSSSAAESMDEYESSYEEDMVEETPLPTPSPSPSPSPVPSPSPSPQPVAESTPAPAALSQEDLANAVRIRCREMFYLVLKGKDRAVSTQHAERLAAELESEIFAIFRKTDFRYKNRFNSRYSNLKDEKNPALRMNFLCGTITPAQLATMSPHELASEEMKKLRASFVNESIHRAQLASIEGNQTDLLKCGKCEKRNCTYNQLQTRSGDEPMTTFVICNECGNRWKF